MDRHASVAAPFGCLVAESGRAHKARHERVAGRPGRPHDGDAVILALPFPAIDPVLIQIGPFAIRWYASPTSPA
jgi:hypothetical protein